MKTKHEKFNYEAKIIWECRCCGHRWAEHKMDYCSNCEVKMTYPIEQLEPEGEVYVECELKDVLIGAPILVAKQGTRTSESYATFPNDYEGERIYLKKSPPQQPSEGEITPQQQDLKFVEELYKDGFLSPKGRETWIKKINNE